VTKMHQLLDAAIERFPDAPAVRDGAGRWSYRELGTACDQRADWLIAQGVRTGDRVAVAARSSREVVATLFACSRVGAVFVPVSPETKPYQLRHILLDSQPRLTVGFAEEWDAGAGAPDVQEAEVEEAADGELAMLIYTSGSTSPMPKAVAARHEEVIFAAEAIGRRLHYHQDDVVFCRLPLSFDYGLYQILLCALAGAELVLVAPGRDARLLSDLNAAAATVIPLVPSIATMLIGLARRQPATAPVRLFTNTGERLPAEVIARLRADFPAAAVVLMFGTTECKRVSILEPDGDLRRPGSVGRPLDGTTVLVVDEDGRPVPVGECGEIIVAGPHVMAGYWRAPELTAKVFRRHPPGDRVWLHTGDFGRLDADGHIYFEGRRDHLFKRRGMRMSVLEIEVAAQRIPDVEEAVVLTPTSERDLTVVVTGDVTADTVLGSMARLLAKEKVPAHCLVLPDLPRTANGKVDRAALAQLADRKEPLMGMRIPIERANT
jgi:amino acid adenylation domain-containing protein